MRFTGILRAFKGDERVGNELNQQFFSPLGRGLELTAAGNFISFEATTLLVLS